MIAQLVDDILDFKRTDPEADTSELEVEVNQLVYKLYGLTNEEIVAVERDIWVD